MQEDRRDSETDSSFVELRDLLADFTTGELTEEQNTRLQQLVASDEKAAQFYLQYMFMYGTIHQEYCGCDGIQLPFTPPTDNAKSSTEGNSSAPNSSIFPLLEIESELLSSSNDTCDLQGSQKTTDIGWGFLGHINFSFVPWVITIIAGVLILSSVIILPIYWATCSPDPKWNVVARITKTVDCRWAQGEEWLQEGDFLTVGQLLDLEIGLTEVEFSSGAKVILQGPARFVIAGRNNSRLDSGKLAAIVPERAEGFKVRTAGMEVVDLGTEFGVAVDTNDRVDVHVFKGIVEMEAATKSGSTQSIRLKQNEAARYDKTSDSVVSIPVDANRFVRDVNSTQGITTKLRVINPSFEVPDIRTVSQYQARYGTTLYYPIYGWKVSDSNPQRPYTVKYQISPYQSPNLEIVNNIFAVATDGRQVLTILLGSLGQQANSPRKKPGEPRCNWVYQSLGFITTADIGKTLKLSVDAGPRVKRTNPEVERDGMLFAGFALHVTPEQPGVMVGESGSYSHEGKIQPSLYRLEAALPISVDLVGQELFVLLGVRDDGSRKVRDEYHFDNVRVVVEE